MCQRRSLAVGHRVLPPARSPFLHRPSVLSPPLPPPPAAAPVASPANDSQPSTPATIHIDGQLEQLVARARARNLRDLRPAASLPTG